MTCERRDVGYSERGIGPLDWRFKIYFTGNYEINVQSVSNAEKPENFANR